jgi:starch synthase (maltosyl-transferring)
MAAGKRLGGVAAGRAESPPQAEALPHAEGRKRVVIEGVQPEIDGGRFPIKRVAGDTVIVEADVHCDGHDFVGCCLLHRRESEPGWQEIRMEPLGNDRWRASFPVVELGRHRYTIESWVDHFHTWRSHLSKRIQAGQDASIDILIGARLIEEAASRAADADSAQLQEWARRLKTEGDSEKKQRLALDEDLPAIALRYPDRRFATRYERELSIVVDRPRARFSTWYEVFPRSCAPEPGRHGTFRDCERWLDYAANMGFDVFYLPPIHPIGRTFRKGRNNAVVCQPGDPGSPWAIGAQEGGHKSIHPELGTVSDFERLVAKARSRGLEIALDIAFQCTPDHPWVREHPEWFRHRPDGTIQYAENPPKKYQDIYPLDFETENWRELWEELRSVFTFWIGKGVRIFRVDNPHTKAYGFWEWVIGDIKRNHPDVILLSEAFTRPKVMYRLAKLGFSQSYTYFAWRNTKWELTEYFTELTRTEVREYFRPNLWPNTPDILTGYLQRGGRPAFITRLVLAATLGASYGIYGPAFELCENTPREPGSEEYLDSEKYEIRHRDLNAASSLQSLIARVNRARHENPALRSDISLRFHGVDNDLLLCYSKTGDEANAILVVVNLDFQHTQSGWVDLDLTALNIEPGGPFEVEDLLTGGRYIWHGRRNYVELDPHRLPAHVFRVRQREFAG